MQVVDTHAHLDSPEFQAELPQLLERARAAGVERVVAVATSLASSRACIALATQHAGVFATVGVHPNHSHEALPGDWQAIEELARQPAVVALGETGLDRHWDFAPFDLQTEYFERHLALSAQTGLPVIIHTRDCEADMLRVLGNAASRGPLRGVMHSFVGDLAAAEQYLSWGMYISFAGMLTFKKSQPLRDVAEKIPLERLLVETDSPYLAPHPLRGKTNEPAHVVHTLRCLAEVKGMTVSEMAQITTRNAQTLFQLPAV